MARTLILGEALGFYQREGDLTVQGGVVGQVDFLLATFPQELLDLVPAVGEGSRLGGTWYSGGSETTGVSV